MIARVAIAAIRGYDFVMARKTAKNVRVPPKLAGFVDDRVRKGRFRSAGEVVEAGLKLLQAREQAYEAWRKDAARKIAEGLEDLRKGRVRDLDDVMADMEAEEELFAQRPKARRRSA